MKKCQKTKKVSLETYMTGLATRSFRGDPIEHRFQQLLKLPIDMDVRLKSVGARQSFRGRVADQTKPKIGSQKKLENKLKVGQLTIFVQTLTKVELKTLVIIM